MTFEEIGELKSAAQTEIADAVRNARSGLEEKGLEIVDITLVKEEIELGYPPERLTVLSCFLTVRDKETGTVLS